MAGKLGTAFDKEGDGDVIQTDRPTPRPKDAATLILVRRDQAQPRLLMGKRSGKHTFMPDKYVFPGGRVDTADGRVPSLSELRETRFQVHEHLRLEKDAPTNTSKHSMMY